MGRRVIRDLELGRFLKKANFEGALQKNDTHGQADFFLDLFSKLKSLIVLDIGSKGYSVLKLWASKYAL